MNSEVAKISPVLVDKVTHELPRLNPPHTHVEVATRTIDKFEEYFSEPDSEDWSIHAEYLDTYTKGFLGSVKRGFINNVNAIRDPRRIDHGVLTAIEAMKMREEVMATPDDMEAFSRFTIALGLIPEIAVAIGFSVGLSRSQLFEAPFTVGEFLWRISETTDSVGMLINKEVAPDRPLIIQPQVFRAWGVFEAIKHMPLRSPIGQDDEFTQETVAALRGKFADPANR